MNRISIFSVFLLNLLFGSFSYGQVTANFEVSFPYGKECLAPDVLYPIELISSSTGAVAQYEWFTNAPQQVAIPPGTVPGSPQVVLDQSLQALPSDVVITLVVTDTTGNSDTLSKTVMLNMTFAPVVNFGPRYTMEVNAPAEIDFQQMVRPSPGVAITSYDWTLGDGQSSSEANPNYTYEEGGTYTISLRVTDEEGCTTSSETSGLELELTVLAEKGRR